MLIYYNAELLSNITISIGVIQVQGYLGMRTSMNK